MVMVLKLSYNRAIVEQGIKSKLIDVCVCVCVCVCVFVAVTKRGNRESDLGAQSSSYQKAYPLHVENAYSGYLC